MKKILFLSIAVMTIFSLSAQQKLTKGGMTYINMPKPNMIVYHDSIFNGANQFQQLFLRYNDPELNMHIQKHQSNKIAGQIFGLIGGVGMVIGVSELTNGSNNRGLGWSLLGGGFVSSVLGGYLSIMGQRHLQSAVTLFNQKFSRASLNIGVGRNEAGLVYGF